MTVVRPAGDAPPTPPVPPATPTDPAGGSGGAAARTPSSGRLPALDVLRGLAILGTLLTNIWIFSGPSSQVGKIPPPESAAPFFERALSVAIQLTTDGKWIGLLTIMFGIGLEIQRQSAIRRGERWPGRYPWRALLLVLDGVLNYLFIFQFDVLMGYGLTALVVCVVMAGSPRTQKIWMVVGVLLHLAHLAFLQFGMNIGTQTTPVEDKLLAIVRQHGEGAAARAETAKLGGEYVAEFDRFAQAAAASSAETGTESYWAMVIDRATNFLGGRGEIPIMLTMGLGLFLAGAHLYRAGLFRPDGARLRRWVMGLSFGIGLPIDVAVRLMYEAELGAFARYFTSALVSFGVLAAIAAVYARGRRPGRLARPFQLVGRMALTCYLLQNLLCSLIYYDFGLGLANRFAHVNQNLVTLTGYVVVSAMLITLSWAWLRRWERGPVEWLWHASYDAIGRRLDARSVRRQQAVPAS